MSQSQCLQTPESNVPNEEVPAWLGRAGSDILETERPDDQAGYNKAFSWLSCSEADDSVGVEDAEREEDDRQLIASAPHKARRLALSPGEMQSFAPSETCSASSTQQSLLHSASKFCERKFSIPGLLPNAILDLWDRPLIFPKSRRSVNEICRFLKLPRFVLVVDPPEGEELAGWRPLKKSRVVEQVDFHGRFLLPPPRQLTKKGRKQEQKAIRLRT